MAYAAFWAGDGSKDAYYSRKRRESDERARLARAQGEPTGLPWRDVNRVNGWLFICPGCGEEVRCGWDDGLGLPDRTDFWQGRTTVEGECQGCGTVYDIAVTWVMDFDVERPKARDQEED